MLYDVSLGMLFNSVRPADGLLNSLEITLSLRKGIIERTQKLNNFLVAEMKVTKQL